MYSFKNDYSELGHPKVFSDLANVAQIQLDAYGKDEISQQAKQQLAKTFGVESSVIHFLTGGTQTNLVLIASALSPIEAVISADSGHIVVNETGAIEHNGNKIITVKNNDGKLCASQIEEVCKKHNDEHKVRPRLVFVSLPTEKGTIYKKAELASIFEVCKKLGLLLYVDGARLGAALTCDSCDFSPEDLPKLCDAFYIGGTKNGSPIGEALCLVNPALNTSFRYFLKQHGALLSKGGLIGSCFKTLFCDNLYFDLAKNANESAKKLANGLIKKGYNLSAKLQTNQIFAILPDTKILELQKFFDFHIWEKLDGSAVVRLVCSWATDESQIEQFLNML